MSTTSTVKVCSNSECGHREELSDARYCGICGSPLMEVPVSPPGGEEQKKGRNAVPLGILARPRVSVLRQL